MVRLIALSRLPLFQELIQALVMLKHSMCREPPEHHIVKFAAAAIWCHAQEYTNRITVRHRLTTVIVEAEPIPGPSLDTQQLAPDDMNNHFPCTILTGPVGRFSLWLCSDSLLCVYAA